MEKILDQIIYGSLLENWNVVDSLIDNLEESENVPNIKNLKKFLHFKDNTHIIELCDKLELLFKNNDFINKLRLFFKAYLYTGKSSDINSDENILIINTFLRGVEDPILMELFLTRATKSVKDISSHYQKASFLLKELECEKLSNQALAWHFKWKSDEITNAKESASCDKRAAESFKKSGENNLYHDALGLVNIKLMSSTKDLEDQIKYSRKASYHFKKSGNIAVFQLKKLRRTNAIRLFEFANIQDSLLESAKYYKEAANEFKIGGDEVYYHQTMALYYKCTLIDVEDWNDKARIFSKIAFHCKKGKKDEKYFKALGDKYNSLARVTTKNLNKTADLLKKASINYQKADDIQNSHLALGSYYQIKAFISRNRKRSIGLFFKAAEEFKNGKNLSDYYNAIGYAKIFSIPDPDKAKPKLWKEIAENFKKGNNIELQFLSMHNYYLSKYHLTEDSKKRIIYKKESIKALKSYIDNLEAKQTTQNTDKILLSKTGIDSRNLLALYKGKFYRFLAQSENESEKKKVYYQNAIECLTSVLKEHPNAVGLRDLGWVFFEISYFEGSLEAFKEAEKLSPDDESFKIEIEIVEKALIKDYVKTKDEYEKEREARKKSEEQFITLTNILSTHVPSLPKDSFMDRIIRVLSDAGRNFEKRYETFAKLTEPELRDHLLAFLNNEFRDEASGETIQSKGKTDIHIKNPNDYREIVIIECKKWKGEKQYVEGFNQKIGYLTGREKKSILLTFSNRIHFSEVSCQAKKGIAKQISYIENSIKDLKSGSDIHEADFISKHKLDSDMVIKIYHLFFNLGFLRK